MEIIAKGISSGHKRDELERGCPHESRDTWHVTSDLTALKLDRVSCIIYLWSFTLRYSLFIKDAALYIPTIMYLRTGNIRSKAPDSKV